MVAGTIDVSREEIERCKPKYESEEVRTANVIKNLRKRAKLIEYREKEYAKDIADLNEKIDLATTNGEDGKRRAMVKKRDELNYLYDAWRKLQEMGIPVNEPPKVDPIAEKDKEIARLTKELEKVKAKDTTNVNVNAK